MNVKKTLMWAGGILGAFIAYPLLVRYMRSSEARDKLAEKQAENDLIKVINADPETQREALNAITSGVANGAKIQQTAKQLKSYFGVGATVWDFSYWVPEKIGSYKALKEVSPEGEDGKYHVPLELSQCYALICDNKRTLVDDCDDVLFYWDFNDFVFETE